MTIKIKDCKYKILIIPDTDERLHYPGDDINNFRIGMCSYLKCEIYIANNLNDFNFKNTLMHELTHAFIDVYGFFSHRNDFSNEDVCEFIACYGKDIVNQANKCINKLKRSVKYDT